MICIKEAEVLVVLNKNRNKKKNGFTLIELIVVMFLLATLALTVLPRFINFQDDAEKAVVLSTASSFTDALKLVRVKWILAGQPNPAGNSSISYGGDEIKLYKSYPYSVNNIDDIDWDDINWDNFRVPYHATKGRCYALLSTLLTNPPDSSYSDNAEELRNNTFFVYYYDVSKFELEDDLDKNLGGSNACIYYLVSSLNLNELSSLEAQLTKTNLSGFAYNPITGEVISFLNGFGGFDHDGNYQ